MSTEKLWTRNFLALIGANGFLFAGFHFLLPTITIYASSLGATGLQLGLIGGSFGYSAIFIRLFTDTGVRTFGKKKCLYAGLGLCILAVLGYLFFTSINAIILARVIHGFGFGLSTTFAAAMAADVIPASRRGEGIGYFGMGSTVAMALAPALGLWLLEESPALLFAASMSFSAAAILMAWLCRTKKAPAGINAASPIRSSIKNRLCEQGTAGASLLTILFGAGYGSVNTYIAMLAAEKGIDNAGLFFIVGTIFVFISRPFGGRLLDKYGADALRFNLITGNSPGNDMRFYVERCESMRNFANKIWNASRFVLMNLAVEDQALPPAEALEIEDKWILTGLNVLIGEITDALERFELGIAEQKIYDFIWDTFCDWYIELTKPRLYADDASRAETAQRVLVYTLDKLLKLLHPFMPYITEEIWQALPHEGESIMIQPWPKADPALSFPAESAQMEAVMEAIRAIRNRRSEMNVPPSRKSKLYIFTGKPEAYRAGEAFIKKLAFAETMELVDALPEGHEKMVEVVTSEARLLMPLSDLVDIDKELERIDKEIANAKKELARSEGMLKNQGFMSKAPAEKVEAEKAKVEKYKAMLEQLEQSAARLKA